MPRTPSRNALRSRRRRLAIETLEDRLQPATIKPLNVALISDAVAQAAQIQEAAARGVIAVTFDSSTATLDGLVDQLQALSAANGNARISHLGLVAHGSPGAINLGSLDTLDGQDVATNSAIWSELRSLLTPNARIDLYACDVAAGREGKHFVNALADRTGVAVYASTDAVGSGKGADLVWEYNTAVRGRSPLFHPASLKKIEGLVLEDAFEPNNVKAHADVAPGPNSPNLGLLTLQRTINSLFLAADSEDWFRFDIDGVGTSANFVRIESLDPNGEPDLYLYTQNGTEIQRSVFGGLVEQVTLEGLPPGSYYVAVKPNSGGVTTTNYTLQVVPPAAGTDDAFEINDSKPDADRPTGVSSPNLGTLTSSVTLSNLVLRGDQDWFRFDTTGVGTTANFVRIDALESSGDIDLYLYRQDGTEIQRSVFGGASEQVSLHGLPPGSYYIAVGPNSALRNSNSQYTLQVVPPAALADDSYEQNDAKGDADRAPGANSPNLGTIVGSKVLSNLVLRGDVDWFRFTTVASGTSDHFVRLESIDTSGDIDLYLFRQDGTELQRSVFGGFTEQVTLASRPAGTYYVAVVPNGSIRDSSSNYTLQVKAPGSGISIEPAEVTEGDGGLVAAVFSVTRSDPALAGSVEFATADGTAVGGVGAGFDYEPASGTLNFGPGESTKTITVMVRGDVAGEENETFFVNLSNPSGGALLNDTQAVGTILNDDFAGTLQFSAPTYSVVETIRTAFVKVIRTGGSDGAVTVDYTTDDGSAVAPDDYTTTTGTLTFGHGQTVKTIAIPIINDSDSEPDESINLVLTNPTGGAELGDQSTAELVIKTNDLKPGILQFSSPTYIVSEDGVRATITVNRIGGDDGAVTAKYTLLARTAKAPGDFTADTGVLDFADGETTQTFDVEIIDDDIFEPNEYLTLVLSAPTGRARLGAPRTATLTITNDDALITPGTVLVGSGNSGLVKVLEGSTGLVKGTIQAFPLGYRAGVRVATGDVSGDGVPDLVVAGGPNGSASVRIFDGLNGSSLGEIIHNLPLAGGVNVAVGDVNGDSRDDIILGAGGSPQVRVFSGLDRSQIGDFQAFAGTHGVTVAVGDVTGDSTNEIIVGAGIGGPGQAKAFDLGGNTLNTYNLPTGFNGGISVATGDVDGDGKADVIVGAGPGAGPHVKIFKGTTAAELERPLPPVYAATFKGGVTVATGDVNADGILDLIVGSGPGAPQKVKAYDFATGQVLRIFSPFGAARTNGTFVAVAR